VASKKRSSGKGKKAQRKGLSGNPQRRAAQLQAVAGGWAGTEFDDVPYDEVERPRVTPAPWWAESHERVLAAARASTWPSSPLEVETLACRLAGDEFYDRMRSEQAGLKPSSWLGFLASRIRRELQTAIHHDAGDAQQLLSLLLGLTLSAPRLFPFSDSAEDRLGALFMPIDQEQDDKELVLAAVPLAEYALTAWGGDVPDEARRAGDPVFARDAYGSRFLVTAPFSHRGSGDTAEIDHWYAWDIDMCALDRTVGAGAFGSADEALAEWRTATGPSAAGAELAPCPAEMLPVLLDSCLEPGYSADLVEGVEQRELIGEYNRKRQRARALAWHDGFDTGQGYEIFPDVMAFAEWYRDRHPDEVLLSLPATLDTLLANWGPLRYPDAPTFQACSPHRIRIAGILLRDNYPAEPANEALNLLPDWTRWCLSRSGIGADSVWGAHALEAVGAETLVGEDGDTHYDPDAEGPFRPQE
jgi:hypothetical protein